MPAVAIVAWTMLPMPHRAAGQAGQQPTLPEGQVEQEGVETLTHGPIHEAFASPAELDPTPGPVVNRQPPPDVPEEPPEFMPEGAVWIPGYWIWDDEREDFIWVTGVARKPPPGMRFVPGYWAEVDGGWQRVAGFWTSVDVVEVEYREPPPQTLETGPSSPAPADNYFWVPGTWVYYDTGYRWRAGYWSPYQPGWVWIPARWVWTPAGCIFVPGYWDFLLTYRGQFFAPIYFHAPIYAQSGWFYRPWCVIPTSNLFIHLWIRPTYCHYYFGDFYGPRYVDWGFYPWVSIPARRFYYDPFYMYCRVHYPRHGIDFLGRVDGWHNYFAGRADVRPPRTWREQQRLVREGSERVRVETQLVASDLVEVARRGQSPVPLTRLDDQTRQALIERSQRLREMNTARRRVEQEAARVTARLPRAEEPGKADRDRDTERKARDRGTLLEKVEEAQKADRQAKGPSRAAPRPKLTLPAAPEVAVERAARRGPPGVERGPEPGEAAKAPRSSDAQAKRPQPGKGKARVDEKRAEPSEVVQPTAPDEAVRTPPPSERVPPPAERIGRQPPDEGKKGREVRDVASPEERAKRDNVKGRGPKIVRPDEPGQQPRTTGPGREPPSGPGAPVDRPDRGKRPRLGPEAPAPRQPDTKALPDATTPRESRPMPRVEAPRESRPAPRIEAPKGPARPETRVQPRIETPRPQPQPQTEAPPPSTRPSPPSPSSGEPRGKGKGRDERAP